MLAWMLYVIVVTALLGAAALAAERGARLRRAPSRWLWITAIVASLLLPTIIASVSVQIPSLLGPRVSSKAFALREVTSARLSPQAWTTWIEPRASDTRAWVITDERLERGWVAVSALLVIGLLSCAGHLFARKRRWTTGVVGGTFVYVAPDVGPAVVGLIRPSIVVPAWLTQASAEEQAVVIAHEQAHLDARDPQLLTVALCLLVFMPWNLPLWWQLRRLRCAIEVDCDRRVLNTGQNSTDYGKTLIAVAQRQSAYIGAVAAMAESFLERRIQIMVRKQARWWRVSAAALACASLGFVVVAAQVGPPNATTASRERREVSVDQAVLDGYTGYYRMGEFQGFVTISRDGRRLFEQQTGQPKAEIFAESPTEFFLKVVDAQISFHTDAQGYATALVLHQGGMNLTLTRIDAAVADQLTAAIAVRVHDQVAAAGSEVALRRLLAGSLDGVSPELSQIIQTQRPQVQPLISALGAVQSIEFRGVGNQGWDVYDVRYEHGALQWRIALSPTGIVTGAMGVALP